MADLGAIGVYRITPSRMLLPRDASEQSIQLKKRFNDTYSRHIHSWSSRSTTFPTGIATTIPLVPQLFIQHTDGSIFGTVKTGVVIDYNYVVRLYYRPNGYLIDQVRTNIAGQFIFNRDIDVQDIENYYIVAIDAQNNFNAVVYDLLTPTV